MNKIEKTLKKKSDERAILENGKIYKNILEVIVIITNIIYFISLGFGKLTLEPPINRIIIELIMGTINLSTFIGEIKTLKKGTFEGSINIFTYEFSTFHVLNIFYVIERTLCLIFTNNIILNGYTYLIGMLLTLIIMPAETIYMTKKIKQS